MTDPLSAPKLPADISDVALDAKARIRRIQAAKKSGPVNPETDPKLRDVCRQMESLFIHHLFKEMRATIPKSGFINGGRAEEIYTSMLDAETAANISARGGIGLSEMLLHQLGNRSSQIKEEKSNGDE